MGGEAAQGRGGSCRARWAVSSGLTLNSFLPGAPPGHCREFLRSSRKLSMWFMSQRALCREALGALSWASQGNFGNIHYAKKKKNAPKSSTGADSRNVCDSMHVHHFIITVNNLNVHLFFFLYQGVTALWRGWRSSELGVWKRVLPFQLSAN